MMASRGVLWPWQALPWRERFTLTQGPAPGGEVPSAPGCLSVQRTTALLEGGARDCGGLRRVGCVAEEQETKGLLCG